MTTTQRKAKRKLSNISFDAEDSHIALVSTQQGGPANGATLAILKARNFSEEAIAKMQQVKVTMELPDFLQRFMNMWEDDAKFLAKLMGYKDIADTQAMEDAEQEQEYQDWIKSKMEAFEIIDSVQQEEDVMQAVAKLDEDDYLALLNDQALIEKAFRKLERAEKALLKKQKESTAIANAPADEPSVTVGVVEVETSVVNKANKETNMTQEVQVEQAEKVEMVEKSQLEQVLKAQADMQVELQKARDLLSVYEQEKKDAIAKARKQELTAAVKQAEVAEVLFKAVKDAADEDFAAVVKALADMQAVVEKSAMFEEQGASVQEGQEVVQESAVARLLKAKQAK
jgi:hypothetical protein